MTLIKPSITLRLDPRAAHVTIQSAALGIAKSFYLHIPHDLAVGERAPAIYLMRGHEREWVNPAEDGTRGGTTAIDVYERLRRTNAIRPMILVFPGLASDDNRVPSYLANMRAPELAATYPGVGSGRFADYFFDDLMPYVDANYPTLGGRARAAAGFSLGGAMAVAAAARRPDLFASAGAYDGTFLYAVDRGRRVKARDRVLHNPMFDAVFGTPRDPQAAADISPANLILRAEPAAVQSIVWAIGYGPESAEPWQANYNRGEHLVACLRERGADNALGDGTVPDGLHTWRVADAFLERTLPLHDAAMRAAA